MTGLSTALLRWLIGKSTLEGRGLFTLLVSLQIVLLQVSTWGTDLFAIAMVEQPCPDLILAGGLLLLTVFGSTGLGELARVLPHVDAWEGANYLSFGISLIAAYLALMVGEPGGRPMPTHPDGTLLDQAV